jgi:hypothetical protein
MHDIVVAFLFFQCENSEKSQSSVILKVPSFFVGRRMPNAFRVGETPLKVSSPRHEVIPSGKAGIRILPIHLDSHWSLPRLGGVGMTTEEVLVFRKP